MHAFNNAFNTIMHSMHSMRTHAFKAGGDVRMRVAGRECEGGAGPGAGGQGPGCTHARGALRAKPRRAAAQGFTDGCRSFRTSKAHRLEGKAVVPVQHATADTPSMRADVSVLASRRSAVTTCTQHVCIVAQTRGLSKT
jgi:hypothetical protein